MIRSPDINSTRSILADWLELTAYLRGRAAGVGDLDSLYRLNSDNDRIRTTFADGSISEEEIAELGREAFSNRVSEEVLFRATALGESYPFEVFSNPFRISLKNSALSRPHEIYMFMLLMSAYTYEILPRTREIGRKVDYGRRLFHICASFGVAGILRGGKTYWFGFPRPGKTNFATALADMSLKIGYPRAHSPAPAGLPDAAKDDQVDVVGWRMFGDKRIGTLFLVCQAATGEDWHGKSVVQHLEAFLDWFDRVPYRRAMACLAVPFPGHHEVEEVYSPSATFDTAVFNAMSRLHVQHGMLLDRLRITEALPLIADDPNAPQDIAGHGDMASLGLWIEDIVPYVQAVN